MRYENTPYPLPWNWSKNLNGVIAGRDRSAEDRDLFLLGERAAVVGLVVLDGAVEHEERAHQPERARHVVLELNLGARAGEPSGQDRVGQERKARVAAPNLLFELVDALLEIAQANGVGRAVHPPPLEAGLAATGEGPAAAAETGVVDALSPGGRTAAGLAERRRGGRSRFIRGVGPTGASAGPMASTGTTTVAQSVLSQRILDPFFVHHVRSQRRRSDPRGLASYFNTTRRSLFGSPAEVQRLDVDDPPGADLLQSSFACTLARASFG